MLKMLVPVLFAVFLPFMATAGEAQDKVIAAIKAICVEGYGDGKTLEAAESFDGAVKFQDPTPDSVSYRVEVVPERYLIIIFSNEGGACTVVTPLDFAPELDVMAESLGGARHMLDEEDQNLFFLKKHNLMTMTIDARFRGDGMMVRTVVVSNKSNWDHMIAEAESQGRRLPEEFHKTPWLR